MPIRRIRMAVTTVRMRRSDKITREFPTGRRLPKNCSERLNIYDRATGRRAAIIHYALRSLTASKISAITSAFGFAPTLPLPCRWTQHPSLRSVVIGAGLQLVNDEGYADRDTAVLIDVRFRNAVALDRIMHREGDQ